MMTMQCLLHKQNKMLLLLFTLLLLLLWIQQLTILLKRAPAILAIYLCFCCLSAPWLQREKKNEASHQKGLHCTSGDVLESLSNQDIISNHFLKNMWDLGHRTFPVESVKKKVLKVNGKHLGLDLGRAKFACSQEFDFLKYKHQIQI